MLVIFCLLIWVLGTLLCYICDHSLTCTLMTCVVFYMHDILQYKVKKEKFVVVQFCIYDGPNCP